MAKRVNVKEASNLTGLSEYTLRRGAMEARYPHIRIGTPGMRRRLKFDIELLEEYLKQEAIDNATVKPATQENIFYGKLRKIQE